jgi:Methylene-tetrahydrofolate reductase C terminal
VSKRRDPQPDGSGVSASPRPVTPRVSARSMYKLHRLLEPAGAYRRLATWLEARPRARAAFTAAERSVKHQLFGCRMCGQCALPATGYACPMTCPKQLRNGPCGGVGADGSCEVYPDSQCVWVAAFERAASAGHVSDLLLLQRPVDHRRWGQSSWISYWQGRDEGLWTEDDGLTAPAPIRRACLPGEG